MKCSRFFDSGNFSRRSFFDGFQLTRNKNLKIAKSIKAIATNNSQLINEDRC